MHTASANTKIEPIRTFRDHLTVCRSGANVFSRSPYGHHGSAGNGDVRAADEAGMMPGLTPVAAAARGARGESRREGVVLTCADLMLGGGQCMLAVRAGTISTLHQAIPALVTYH